MHEQKKQDCTGTKRPSKQMLFIVCRYLSIYEMFLRVALFMVSTEKEELKHGESFDISFAEIQQDKNWKQTVQKIATAINVQFTESSQQILPFVPSKEFQSLLREQKVFLFGPSGSGKSRTIIELIRNNGRYDDHNNEEEKGVDNSNDNNGNNTYKRIFVINPSNPAGL